MIQRADAMIREFSKQYAHAACRAPVSKTPVLCAVVNVWEAVLRSGEDSGDMRLSGRTGTVRCHSLILQEASPVLKAMLSGSMRESVSKEIQVPETEVDAIRLFLEVVYLGSCSGGFLGGSSSCSSQRPRSENPASSSEGSESGSGSVEAAAVPVPMEAAAALVALDLAHRWQVGFAVDSFERMLIQLLDLASFAAVADAAVRKSLPGLLVAAKRFAQGNAEVKAKFERQEGAAKFEKQEGNVEVKAKFER